MDGSTNFDQRLRGTSCPDMWAKILGRNVTNFPCKFEEKDLSFGAEVFPVVVCLVGGDASGSLADCSHVDDLMPKQL